MTDTEIKIQIEKMESEAFKTLCRMASMLPECGKPEWIIEEILKQRKAIQNFINDNIEDD